MQILNREMKTKLISYYKLPGCCQYKRDENRKKNNHHGTTESGYKKVEKSGACCDNK